MPNRCLQFNLGRIVIVQAPHVGTARRIRFRAVAGDLCTGREGNDIFQIRAVFFNRHAQPQGLNAVARIAVINIISGTNQSVMRLMDDTVYRTLIRSVFGNRFHGTKSFAVIVAVIHDSIISLLKIVCVCAKFFLPLYCIGYFQDILGFTAIIMNNSLCPKPGKQQQRRH